MHVHIVDGESKAKRYIVALPFLSLLSYTLYIPRCETNTICLGLCVYRVWQSVPYTVIRLR